MGSIALKILTDILSFLSLWWVFFASVIKNGRDSVIIKEIMLILGNLVICYLMGQEKVYFNSNIVTLVRIQRKLYIMSSKDFGKMVK